MGRFLAIAGAIGVVASSVEVRGAPSTAPCALDAPGSAALPTQECLRCHASAGAGPTHGNHPVDLDYDVAQGRSAESLRPLAEVVRRGVLLPENRLHCVTCHDAGSPWAGRIALPPGSVPVPAVNPRDPATYEKRDGWRAATGSARVAPGSAVSPSPLCIACHALD